MTTVNPPDIDQKIQVRVEATDIKMYTRFYAVDRLPDQWSTMEQEEQHMWLCRFGTWIKENVEDVQERTDGVFVSWDNSHPEWTVTFSTSTSAHTEIVSAPSERAAIEKAREHLKIVCGAAYASMMELTADVKVQGGRYGI
jgi:hypothetical protein